MNQQTEGVQIVEKDDEIEIDLMELLFYYRSKWLILLAAFLIGAIVVGGFTYFFITPKYTATSKVYMVSSSNNSVVDLTDLNIGTSLSKDYVELLKIRPIYEEIIREYKYPYTYEQLLGMTTIGTLSDTRILTISVESTDPEEACEIANALARKAVSKLPKLMDTNKPNIAEDAIVPKHKSSPNLAKNTTIGALVAMLAVGAVLTIIYLTDDTLNSADEVEKAFGIMPLTIIPEGEMAGISDKAEEEIRKRKRQEKKRKRKSSKKSDSEEEKTKKEGTKA